MKSTIHWSSLVVCSLAMVIFGSLSGTRVEAAWGVSTSPSSLSFGSVSVNKLSSPQGFTVMNMGNQRITIQNVASSSNQFKVMGLSLPLTLQPGQGTSFQVVFGPTNAGTFSGSINVSLTRYSRGGKSIAVSGTGLATAPTPTPTQTYLLSASATALNLGSVLVGGSSTQSVVLTNTGNSSVGISQVAVAGAGFTAGGFAVPLTLAAGQSTSLTVAFSPLAAGSVSGSVSVVSNATNSPATIALMGTGSSQTLQLTPSATSLSFGSVLVGNTSSSQTVAIANTGNSSVTISQVSATGTGFKVSGIATPLTLAAGQGASMTVVLSPAAAGSIIGSVSVVSNATNSPTTINLTGTGVQPQISVIPGSVAFGNVAVGVSNTQTMTIQNTGTANLNMTQATVSGPGFALSGLALPYSLAAGGSKSFTVSFSPTSAINFSGTLSMVSNAPGSPSTVGLSGTGLAQTLQLSVSPSSLSFGSATVGTNSSQTVTISNTGNGAVSVTQIGVSGTAYSVTGTSLPVSLNAGQSASYSVVFTPLSAGNLAGSISIVSNANNSPATVMLSGSGVQAMTHSVSLTWTDTSSGQGGFNIYRGTKPGGPYAMVNSALVPTVAYTDSGVQSGATYYYVTTAVDLTGIESTYSNEAAAAIP